jgi:hypothetical protein
MVDSMRGFLHNWGWEVLCLAVLVCLVGYQIFLPPVTGLANNFDFSKVLGIFSLCGVDHEAKNNQFLITDYVVEPRCAVDQGLTSIETPFVAAALRLSERYIAPGKMDLRVLGAIHLAILALGFALMLGLTRHGPPVLRFGIPALFILIFSDVAYTGYLNSVYMDAPAMVLLVAATAIAAIACYTHHSRIISGGYLILGVALVFSKSQHALLGLAFAGVAVAFACRPAERMVRVEWTLVAMLLTGSSFWMLMLTPGSFKINPLFDVIFSRLMPHSDAPWDVIKEVGLSEDDLKYLGSHSYLPTSPVNDPKYVESFLQRTSFTKVAVFYLHHPDVAFSELHRDLVNAAPVLRPKDMPNYREQDGFPPGTMATRFSLWSNVRSWVLRVFPYSDVLLFVAPWILLATPWRSRFQPLLPLLLALSAAGIIEFCFSALLDALDNSRHLFIFQVLTELMILLYAAALARSRTRATAFRTKRAALRAR